MTKRRNTAGFTPSLPPPSPPNARSFHSRIAMQPRRDFLPVSNIKGGLVAHSIRPSTCWLSSRPLAWLRSTTLDPLDICPYSCPINVHNATLSVFRTLQIPEHVQSRALMLEDDCGSQNTAMTSQLSPPFTVETRDDWRDVALRAYMVIQRQPRRRSRLSTPRLSHHGLSQCALDTLTAMAHVLDSERLAENTPTPVGNGVSRPNAANDLRRAPSLYHTTLSRLD
ncbi:hypothetical protein EYR38_007425 [Pleurotus pulmonarius]|nr:hypothetical protein EYR38_007425 [Pleurotus pulmonarius]